VVEIIQCESREVLSRYEVQLSSEPADEMVMSQINESRLISQFELCQNYPNPFNPETTISYTIPEEGHVTIYIYNPLGQKIRTLIHENQGVGKHRIIWDSKNDMFEDVSSGVYFYQIRYKNESRIRKMILMR